MIKYSIFFLIFWACSSHLYAEPKTKELNQVQHKIKDLKGNLSRLKKKKGKAISALQNVEREYGKISRSIRNLNTKVSIKKKRIKEIKKEINVQVQWLKTQKSQLSGQVRAAYALGHQEQLKLFFNQQDAERSSRMLQYYQYFNNARIQALKRINNSLQLLKHLEREKHQEMQLVSGLILNKQSKKTDLKKSKQIRKKVLAGIKKNVKRNTQKLSKLKKEAKALELLFTNLQKSIENKAKQLALKERQLALKKKSTKTKTKKKKTVVLSDNPAKYYSGKSFSQLKRRLPWPVKGKVLKKFGSKRLDSTWNGMLIGAKEGTSLHAIAHGQVVFADWFKGYGLLIIVKHDKNYMSLYAFNQSLYVAVGDWVKAGGLLATVGNSGGREHAGLYFEIRKRNRAINPGYWLIKH